MKNGLEWSYDKRLKVALWQLEESQETSDHSQICSKVRVSRLSHFS